MNAMTKTTRMFYTITFLIWTIGLSFATFLLVRWQPLRSVPEDVPIESVPLHLATLGALRIVILLALSYFALAMVLSLVSITRQFRICMLLTPPLLRRVCQAMLIASLSNMSPNAASATNNLPEMVLLDSGPTTSQLTLTSPITTLPQSPSPSATVAPPNTKHTITVTSGDNIWVIADEALREHLQREPHEYEIVAYWHAIIKENQHVLTKRNPDLIFPGERLRLPVVSFAP